MFYAMIIVIILAMSMLIEGIPGRPGQMVLRRCFAGIGWEDRSPCEGWAAQTETLNPKTETTPWDRGKTSNDEERPLRWTPRPKGEAHAVPKTISAIRSSFPDQDMENLTGLAMALFQAW